MANFKKNNDYKNLHFAALLNDLSLHVFSDIVEHYERQFRCASCSHMPNVCYLSKKCEHFFCEICVPFISACPICFTILEECDLTVDKTFWIFKECYKRKHQNKGSSGRALSVENLITVKKPDKYNYLLQEECRKFFNRNPSPVKNYGTDLENIKLLVNFGANPNVLNKDGWTLLHEAVDYGCSDVLQVLLRGGGLVNAYSLDRFTTCLHDALDDEVVNMYIVQLLLAYGADIHARDRTGSTAITKAKHKGIDLVSLTVSCPKQHSTPQHKPEDPPLFCGSELSPSNQKLLNDFCMKFKFKQCSRQKVSKEVTHVIVEKDPCQPYFPVLLGILNGSYIITFKWVEDCLKENIILPLEEYEVTGTRDFPNTGVPKLSRINSAVLRPKLFAGGQFNIFDSHLLNAQEKEQLVDLITTGGGKVLTRTNSCGESIGESFFYHAHGGPLEFCTVVVLHKAQPHSKGWETIGHFPLKWVYKAIQTFKIAP